MSQSPTPLILASTSPYRKALLGQLGLRFEAKAPRFDEETLKGSISDPTELAKTLGFRKAESLSTPENCVIGGDQLVSTQGQILGKPKGFEAACQQLSQLSGQSHQLITAVTVIFKGQRRDILDMTEIRFRKLTNLEIENYVRLDEPYDCAGGYKIEKGGLSLCDSIQSQDFSAIQGLPLMALTKTLIQLGYQIPGTERQKA